MVNVPDHGIGSTGRGVRLVRMEICCHGSRTSQKVFLGLAIGILGRFAVGVEEHDQFQWCD